MQKYTEVSLDTKQQILQEYQPGVRGKGFKSLAKAYKIKSGHQIIQKWYRKWDGSKESLKKESGGDRRSILSDKEKKTLIVGFINKRAKKNAANYPEVHVNIESKTKKKIKARSVRRLGKELGAKSKKSKRKCPVEGETLFLNFFV